MITVLKPLNDLLDVGLDTTDPVVLTVSAEEMTTSAEIYPALSTQIQIGLIIDATSDYPPKFSEEV